jgi:RHS repeat-associated protein
VQDDLGRTINIRQSYRYDAGGNVQRVYTDASSPDVDVTLGAPGREEKDPAQCRGQEPISGPGASERKRVTRYCFDELNRMQFASGYGQEDPKEISYDGLDRRDRTKVTKPDGPDADSDPDVVVRDLTYLGTSELLARESPAGAPTGQVRVAFDYDSRGDRIGQQTSRGLGRFYTYDKDANGSVLGLEEEGDDPSTGATESVGQITDGKRYRYDPYGSLDIDEASASSSDQDRFGLEGGAAENPFRFEGFYADSATDSYDMHARGYRPGGAQFLSRDVYASAAGDFALTADLLTQNRYAFAGGNPVNNIEFDGHMVTDAGDSASGGCKVRHCDAEGNPGRADHQPASGPIRDSTGETRESGTISPPSVAEQRYLGTGPKSVGWGGVHVSAKPITARLNDIGAAFSDVDSPLDVLSRAQGAGCSVVANLHPTCQVARRLNREEFDRGERAGNAASDLALPVTGAFWGGALPAP